MLDALEVRKASLVLAVAPPSLRALDPHLIADAAMARGVEARVASSAASAVDYAMSEAGENSLILVSGSLYLVAEARAFLRN